MKWVLGLLAILLVAALGWLPFQGTDVAALEPAQSIYVALENGTVLVETDGGWFGKGETVDLAVADLKASAPGQVFLQTVDYLLLQEESRKLLPALYSHLRSGCNVCLTEEKPDLEKASAYLEAHKPEFTLQNFRAGNGQIPKLRMKGDRAYLNE